MSRPTPSRLKDDVNLAIELGLDDPKDRQRRRTYSNDEVTEIVRLALSRGPQDRSVTYDEMLSIARDLGLSEDEVGRAVSDLGRSRKRERRHEHALRGLRMHQKIYGIVIAGLAAINFLTEFPNVPPRLDDWWFLYPAVCWGVAVLIHRAAVK